MSHRADAHPFDEFSSGAPDMPWTPSDAVLLAPDAFAPSPPIDRSPLARFVAEARLAGWPLVGAALFVMLAFSAEPMTAGFYWGLGLALACVAGYAWYRARTDMDARLIPEGMVFPLGLPTGVMEQAFVVQAIRCALLANEAAGLLRLELDEDDDCARVRPLRGDARWPADSLEDRLRADRDEDVRTLVWSWLAADSYAALDRSFRLLQAGMAVRGLATSEPLADGRGRSPGRNSACAYRLTSAMLAARGAPPQEAALALLSACAQQRPALWAALETSITAGISARQRAPRLESRGPNVTVPVYDYVEPALEHLDARSRGEPAAAMPSVDGSAEFVERHASAPWGRGPIGLAVTVVITALLCAIPFGQPVFFAIQWRRAPLAGLVTGAVVLLSRLVWRALAQRWVREHPALDVASPSAEALQLAKPGVRVPSTQRILRTRMRARQRPTSVATSVVVFTGVVTLIGTLGGTVWFGLALAAFGLLFLGISAHLNAYTPSEVSRAVAERLRAMQDAEQVGAARSGASLEESSPGAQHGTPPVRHADSPGRAAVPLAIVDGEALDEQDPTLIELLTRPASRRRALFRAYWLGAGLLVSSGTATVLALAFLVHGGLTGNAADAPVDDARVVLVLMAATCSVFLVLWCGSQGQMRVPTEGDVVPLAPQVLAWTWRFLLVGIAVRSTWRTEVLLLALVALHWAGMAWSVQRIGVRYPVPSPARLTLLRVFGSASFDDLVALITPWRHVGLIEHLEGFDTVGEREDAQRALAAGRLDEVLALSPDDVRRQLDSVPVEPDDALMFARHAFQCGNGSWQLAVQAMLDRTDAVLMDLTKLSPSNAGCAWELGQLLDRVPLSRVTLLANDNTDLTCLQDILDECARHIAPTSPNLLDTHATWRVVRIGGLSARHAHESYFDWRRRHAHRLDANQLTWALLRSATPRRAAVRTPNARETSDRWLGRWDRLSPVGPAILAGFAAVLTLMAIP